MNILSNQQRAELRARDKLERDRRICDRIKAVLLFDKGWTYEEIAEALLLTEGEKLKAHLSSAETICFIDGVHPTHNVQSAYGWIKKGDCRTIPANTGRSRLNLTGSIDVLNHRVHIREDKTLDTSATIAFFQELEEAYPTMNKVPVFCDNAPYDRNREVTEHLKRSKIQLHFLPPYTPNLNPIERLCKWMKESVVYNTFYEEFEAFKEAVLRFFGTLNILAPDPQLGKQFRSRVRDKFSVICAYQK